jgi:hypothetical protein
MRICHVRYHVELRWPKFEFEPIFKVGCLKRRIVSDFRARSTTQGMSNADEEKKAVTLENESVHRVYEIIASHFSDTRYKVCRFLANADDSHGRWWKSF